MSAFLRAVKPWHVVLATLLLYLGIVLAIHGGDPLGFVRLGHGPNQGYDGQFTYLIATNADRNVVTHEIGIVRADVPAYRYQRILLPVLGRLLGGGEPRLIAWTIPLINIVAHTMATALLAWLLASLSINVWHALVYGLWTGLLLGVRADLTEPLSFALVIAGYVLHSERRAWFSAAAFGLALFAKETALLFVVALLASSIAEKQWRATRALLLLAAAPFAVWQVVLRSWFGEIGLGSGGYLGTPFEVIPFNGLWRIAGDNLSLFVASLIIFGPAVILPCVWGILRVGRELLSNNWHPYVFALGINAAMLLFTPFSTFREPGAMLRLTTGLVLSTLLYAGHAKSHRVLNRSWLWLTLLIFLRE